MASEDPKQPTYDFDFICQTLSLVQWRKGAFNLGAVASIRFDEHGNAICALVNSPPITLSPADMVELEQTLKRKIETTKIIQREAMKESIKNQIEISAELQSGVQPTVIGVSASKRFRQQ